MLDNDIQNFDAVIHQNVQLFLGSLGCVPAGQNRSMPTPSARR